jgi:dTMP kinase
MRETGFLISIEGIDGSGKTLLSQNLHKALLEKKLNVMLTREPGDTVLGKKLRHILHEEKENVCDIAEYLLFAADRAQHFHELIIPYLQQGKIIISDRMNDSSVAYQGYARNLDIEMIKKINQWAMQNIKPNVIFYVKIDIKTAIHRIFARKEKLTSFEQEKTEFWQKVLHGYKDIFKNRKNVIELDGTKTPEEVCTQAVKALMFFDKLKMSAK